jgi:hypothetical protein
MSKHAIRDTYGPRGARGYVLFSLFDTKTRRSKKVLAQSNLVLYSGADILAKLLSGAQYPANAMYLEFKNLADPSDPIVPPVFDRTGGIEYYNGLSSSPDTDFLRVPLAVSPNLTPSSVNYVGNQVTFFAQTEGLSGFHGKLFGPASNSAVFGAGLVAAPDLSDQSQDVLFSRVYAGIDKVLKETGFEIGVTWTIIFS